MPPLPQPPVADRTAPVLSKVRLAPRRFRAGARVRPQAPGAGRRPVRGCASRCRRRRPSRSGSTRCCGAAGSVAAAPAARREAGARVHPGGPARHAHPGRQGGRQPLRVHGQGARKRLPAGRHRATLRAGTRPATCRIAAGSGSRCCPGHSRPSGGRREVHGPVAPAVGRALDGAVEQQRVERPLVGGDDPLRLATASIRPASSCRRRRRRASADRPDRAGRACPARARRGRSWASGRSAARSRPRRGSRRRRPRSSRSTSRRPRVRPRDRRAARERLRDSQVLAVVAADEHLGLAEQARRSGGCRTARSHGSRRCRAPTPRPTSSRRLRSGSARAPGGRLLSAAGWPEPSSWSGP